MGLEAIQEAIDKLPDADKAQLNDGYHTFQELYDHRIALFVRLVNETLDKDYAWRKSKYHHDGSYLPGWFIVKGYIDEKQLSYHLPSDVWDLVKCPDVEKSGMWDGHTPADVVQILLGK